ncbi:MAG: DNA polymerase III subunit beta [Dehalococcoidales bacterium]|nr:DNA polymerase III subunit beta [Dehalococcoidales bacterium]
MEIQVNKLKELLELVKPVISKKSTLKATSYIRVGDGKAVATDLETMVIADLPEATEPMLLPFASLADSLKYIPGNGVLKIEAQNRKISLAWNGGTASYPTEDVEDFPVLPEMPTRAEGLIDGDTLMPAMAAALSYAATEEGRPILCGVTLVLGNPIEVAAGDGFTMSHQVLALSFPLEEKIILPARSVHILGYVFARTPRTPPSGGDSIIPIIIAKRQLHMALLSKGKVRFDFGSTASVIVNLIDGNPPEFLKLIPKGEPILQSQLFAPQLEAAVKRVRAIAKDGSGIVRLVFADGKLTVSARGEEQEIAATMDTITTQGEPGRTAVNYDYLLRYLSGKQGIIVLSHYDKTGPVVFEYQSSPRVLIMPMFVEWGDEPVAAKEPEASLEKGTADAAQETDEGSPEPVEAVAVATTPTRKNRSRKATK